MRLDERLLCGVLGQVVITKDGRGIGHGDVLIGSDQAPRTHDHRRLVQAYERRGSFTVRQTPSMTRNPDCMKRGADEIKMMQAPRSSTINRPILLRRSVVAEVRNESKPAHFLRTARPEKPHRHGTPIATKNKRPRAG